MADRESRIARPRIPITYDTGPHSNPQYRHTTMKYLPHSWRRTSARVGAITGAGTTFRATGTSTGCGLWPLRGTAHHDHRATSSSSWRLPPRHSYLPVGSPFSTSTHTTPSESLFASPLCNIPAHIQERITSDSPKLYQQPSHPLHTIQHKIHDYFGSSFTTIDSLSPIVSTQDNFDSLLIPTNHPSRSRSDTYYLNETHCLRTHTSAHQVQLLREGHSSFLCTGDVYRKDDIDSSHYPIFHQMEGVKLFTNHETPEEILADLQDTLLGLAHHLFGPIDHYRWMPEYFPFTHPSVELEILYRKQQQQQHTSTSTTSSSNIHNQDHAQWLEVLGCGVMQPSILAQAGLIHLPTDAQEEHKHVANNVQAWAFGLGLERLAMILYDIPDIRLFWLQGCFLLDFRRECQ
jgi:phenylalanyl-tRNA synthetase alpha chain